MDIVAVTAWDEEEVSILDGEKLKPVICGSVVSDSDDDAVLVVVVLSQVVVLSEVVVLSVLFEPSLLLQEMTVKLKRDMRIMDKTLFIFTSIPKVKYYCFVH